MGLRRIRVAAAARGATAGVTVHDAARSDQADLGLLKSYLLYVTAGAAAGEWAAAAQMFDPLTADAGAVPEIDAFIRHQWFSRHAIPTLKQQRGAPSKRATQDLIRAEARESLAAMTEPDMLALACVASLDAKPLLDWLIRLNAHALPLAEMAAIAARPGEARKGLVVAGGELKGT